MKKIAYLILAHADPSHFSRLVAALGNRCDIYVHVDRKSDITSFLAATNRNNVKFIDERISVSWAGISMIDALNSLFKEAIKKKGLYSHLITLTGSCYPIKKAEQIHAIMMQKPKREFIKYIDMRESPEHHMKQISRKWFMEPLFEAKNTHAARIDKAVRKALNMVGFRNHWDKNLIPFYGNTWCALTPDCCEFLIKYQHDNPWYREMNRYTFAVDEHYFHTLIGNSRFRDMSDGKQLFLGRGLWRLANLHIIDMSLSKWYTIDDWDEIANSDKLFVRKIRSLDGLELVERINKEILDHEHSTRYSCDSAALNVNNSDEI